MTMSVNDASVFTDLSGLNNIRQLGRENEAAGLKQVAQQFEAMFLNMMLKSMRASEDVLFGDNYTNSNEMKFHRQNFDQQLGLHLSETGGVGLADQLYRQLSQRYDINASSEGEVGRLDAGDNNQGQEFPLPSYRVPVQSQMPNQSQAPNAVQQQAPVINNAAAFEQPEDFVRALEPAARKVAGELGVDSKVLLAQAALETGWGQKMIRSRDGHESHNLFGIKSSPNWSGSQVEVSTLEYRDGMVQRERAQFRAYGSFEDSFRDYANVLRSNGRYSDALNAGVDSELFAERLQEAGYATDPAYAEKIKAVMRHPAIEATNSGSVIR
ncbi:peptidoglycan hydrolase FlgJ [Pseudohongiella nitratireducens]|uniref:Peptidoglycan hydrolase FlgJ n=1 Tax=Pseudohongiella nitratireducens TaxID=1768907 RepID=A0A917GUG5_9GAMM|nr:flagellar assembly peptidoglycan hydrolase FlgJ [Pseudohongiella nitratireducens]GGG57272.1 peptidoglycan hydrolase FlgJ [Pseudohongiella nitratireducens]